MNLELKIKMKSNIWKLMLILLTHKRYYLPLLSIYFLTLPGATAQQIGLWAGIAYLSEAFFELPSGYISDRIGHKKMLIFSKLSMLVAVGILVFATSLWSFILAAILTSLSWAALSGTNTAMLHNTLEALGKGNEFIKINLRQSSYTALFGAGLFVLLPLLVGISIRAPFVVSFVIDAIGFIIAFTLTTPPAQKYKDESPVPLKIIIGGLWKQNFFPVAIYITIIGSVVLVSNRFLYPYLEYLAMPVVYMGFLVAAISLSQFALGMFVSNYTHRVNFSYLFFIDLLLFPLAFLIMAFTQSYWIVVALMLLRGSYARVRKPFLRSYVLENFVTDKRYKATILSVLGQTRILMAAILVFAIGPVFNISYQTGFIVFGFGILMILLGMFGYIKVSRVLEKR